MIVKTRKYKLPTRIYIQTGLKNILREQWWVGLIFLAICSMYFVLPSHWWITGAVIALVLYLLFWLIQFAGMTQLDQGKVLFQKLSYEIDSRQILIKISTKQGMPITWDKIKRASKAKDHFILVVNKAQFIYLPFKIFNNDNQIKFIESILRKKSLIK